MKNIKNYFFKILLLLSSSSLFGQVKMGDHPQIIHPYSILEIESSKQGILIPRLTSSQRDRAFKREIPNALMIFNRTNNCLEIYLSDIEQWRCLQNKTEEKEIKLHLKNNALSLDAGEEIDLSPYLDNTDDQKLTLNGTTLALERGDQVDLGPLLTAEEKEIKLHLKNNALSLDAGEEIDLSPYLDNTDDQKLTLNGTTLALERGDQVDLGPLLTAEEKEIKLHLKNNALSLDAGEEIDLSPYLDNTDNQKLTLNGTTLALERGDQVDLGPLLTAEEKEIKLHLKNNALSLDAGEEIDLSPYLDNTDDQKLTLNGTTLALERGDQVDLGPLLTKDKSPNLKLKGTILSLENGGNVDLAPLFGSVQDHQKIDLFEMKENHLMLSLEDDEEPPKTIDLSKINTDHQTLSLKNDTLKIIRGNMINLARFIDNTDEQQLTLSLTDTSTARISLENGNNITIKGGNNILLSLQNSQTLLIQSKTGVFTNKNHVTSNAFGDVENDDFVFGSGQLENVKGSNEDNKRFFFDKSKAAFRAGIAQSDQWDDKNVGTYSTAMGRNTIASGYHATALGSGTNSAAWYTTAMGNGTSAVSHSETSIGRYNTIYTPKGGTRNWEPTDRLLVIGNGTGNTKTLRSDALVMLKNGNTNVSGYWTGPGFTNLSDKRLKTNIQPTSNALEIITQLKPKVYQLKNDPTVKTHFGLLASELQTILPNLVYKGTDQKQHLSINYTELIPLLIGAIQELNLKITEN